MSRKKTQKGSAIDQYNRLSFEDRSKLGMAHSVALSNFHPLRPNLFITRAMVPRIIIGDDGKMYWRRG